ncbi:MAG: helix-turn-helix domain-containing protein [Myxococcota bacterium]|nr:helix-turn-helix domain-containing protein [Myxococcota bacterium]
MLDAAVRCIQHYGLTKTGLADIATEAGVTRRTVYRYFPDRDAIVAATLIRGVGEFARAARDLIASIADPGEAVVEAILFALRELPRDPLLGSLILAGEVKLTDAEFPDAMRVLEYVLAPLSEAAHWKPDDLEECGELVMRLGLSLMASPRVDRSEKELRAFLHRRVVPALRLDRQQ